MSPEDPSTTLRRFVAAYPGLQREIDGHTMAGVDPTLLRLRFCRSCRETYVGRYNDSGPYCPSCMR